jgi:hypothetical protein
VKRIWVLVFTCLVSVGWLQGQTITFNVPGAGTASGQGTFGDVVAQGEGVPGWYGTVLGSYVDSSGVQHGFLRSPSGVITNVDPPGSVQTVSLGLDPILNFAGYYLDSNGVAHGFQNYDGNKSEFDAPGAGTAPGQGTFTANINFNGTAGYYMDSNGTYHGFLNTYDGAFTTFDAPGAGTGLLKEL